MRGQKGLRQSGGCKTNNDVVIQSCNRRRSRLVYIWSISDSGNEQTNAEAWERNEIRTAPPHQSRRLTPLFITFRRCLQQAQAGGDRLLRWAAAADAGGYNRWWRARSANASTTARSSRQGDRSGARGGVPSDLSGQRSSSSSSSGARGSTVTNGAERGVVLPRCVLHFVYVYMYICVGVVDGWMDGWTCALTRPEEDRYTASPTFSRRIPMPQQLFSRSIDRSIDLPVWGLTLLTPIANSDP
jgi:hypothetical protein